MERSDLRFIRALITNHPLANIAFVVVILNFKTPHSSHADFDVVAFSTT